MVKHDPKIIESTEALTRQRITARAAVQHFEPMLAQFVATIPVFFTEGTSCFTDGHVIHIGKEFGEKMPRGYVFALYHEMWHMALNHMMIFKAISNKPNQHALHNVLCDAKINGLARRSINFSDNEWAVYRKDIITSDNLMEVLDGQLKKGWREAIEDIDMNETHRVFRTLVPFLREEFVIEVIRPGSGAPGLMEGPGELGDGVTDEKQRQMERSIAQSIAASKSIGKGTGNAKEELEELWGKQKVPWTKIISQSILTRFQREKSWCRLNKKSFFI